MDLRNSKMRQTLALAGKRGGKAIAAGLALALCASLLSACGNGSNDSKKNEGAKGTATITAYDTEPQSPLVPGDTNETGGGKPIGLLFSQLVRFEPNGKAVNEVAESIKPDATLQKYTIRLKDGWKFSDGTPVTAKSFTRAWSYTANAKDAQKGTSYLTTIKGYKDLQDPTKLKGDEQLSGLSVVDDRTFTVDLEHPDATFPIKIGCSAFSPLPDAFFKDPKGFGQHPVGNGPYKFVSWDHDASIKLVKNPYYHGGRMVKNAGVTFKVYTSDQAAYSDVQGGQLDVMEIVPAADSKSFKTDPQVTAYNKPGSRLSMLGLTSRLPHFVARTEEGTLRRQAVSMAIDRKNIINKILYGTATPAREFTSPLVPGYSPNLPGNDVLNYNPKKARELWAKAEAISKDTDPLVITYNSDSGLKPVYDAIANSIKNTIGLEVKTNPMPTFKEYRSAVEARKVVGATRYDWTPEYPSPEAYLFQHFDTRTAHGAGANDTDYINPDFDVYMDKAYAAKSTAEANKIYQESQAIILKDLPVVPLYYNNAHGVADKAIKGFGMDWSNNIIYENLTK
ncbi:ABC transporter substrate-binding protein [Bifidobacterium sp. ESL0769]|uniref:peptide ABC transporter substrate-binding protein n=1 Tax=Bifidobacterium sp. ESL0769 TaxID=2983229 RepID=UPI0023F9AABF|nr:ABC transporter substrate-binding protein [Bifidobacterium sp. ESL0769]WEV66720.1 ABC transporter substrate-binding protein [Bifidobacterium sp. ESL0769]